MFYNCTFLLLICSASDISIVKTEFSDGFFPNSRISMVGDNYCIYLYGSLKEPYINLYEIKGRSIDLLDKCRVGSANEIPLLIGKMCIAVNENDRDICVYGYECPKAKILSIVNRRLIDKGDIDLLADREPKAITFAGDQDTLLFVYRAPNDRCPNGNTTYAFYSIKRKKIVSSFEIPESLGVPEDCAVLSDCLLVSTGRGVMIYRMKADGKVEKLFNKTIWAYDDSGPNEVFDHNLKLHKDGPGRFSYCYRDFFQNPRICQITVGEANVASTRKIGISGIENRGQNYFIYNSITGALLKFKKTHSDYDVTLTKDGKESDAIGKFSRISNWDYNKDYICFSLWEGGARGMKSTNKIFAIKLGK